MQGIRAAHPWLFWLAWQVDTARNVPSYTAGFPGDGFLLPHAYGTFPAQIGSGSLTTTDDVWTEYITYGSTPTSTPLATGVPVSVGGWLSY